MNTLETEADLENVLHNAQTSQMEHLSEPGENFNNDHDQTSQEVSVPIFEDKVDIDNNQTSQMTSDLAPEENVDNILYEINGTIELFFDNFFLQ